MKVNEFELVHDPGRVSGVDPEDLTGVLVLEVRGPPVTFIATVVPPFMRVREEDLPQAQTFSFLFLLIFVACQSILIRFSDD